MTAPFIIAIGVVLLIALWPRRGSLARRAPPSAEIIPFAERRRSHRQPRI